MEALKEGDIVHMDDQTKGSIVYMYKYKQVAVIEIDGEHMNIPTCRLSKTKFKPQKKGDK
ncbi:MAG: hypothetical protein KAQ85_10295 [Thermodesulfovibrionia bacterium]|jgi:hypothetical protein|nr:hypothetical protein [Thermodesulfovibrionia bacterium]|tara:strand:- start:5700 stop:5879 length:180 start_codon:yes stop_codon:yes gene_type:complete